jgi:hypothetical protein
MTKFKKLLCFFIGHKWTSKSLRNEPVDTEAIKQDLMKSFYDYAKLYCARCGKESKLNLTRH